MLPSLILGAFILSTTEAIGLSQGSAEFTNYYTMIDIRKNIDYLKGNFTNLKDATSLNGHPGLTYGEGDIKILILGGLSGCPLCTLLVFHIADVLGPSIKNYEKTLRIYNYTKIDMYPLINKDAYEYMISSFGDENRYIEVKGEGPFDTNGQCPSGYIPDCNFPNFFTASDCCGSSSGSTKIASALMQIAEGYDIIINIQGFGKNRILYPYARNGDSLNKQNQTMYNYLETFFKGFSAESSYDRFGSKTGSFIDYVFSIGKTIMQMEVGTLGNKYSKDSPILSEYADSFLNNFLMNGASIPSALINDVWVSRDTDSNGRYTIRVNIAIQNRYPFTLERYFRINITPSLAQGPLNFQFSKASLSYTIDSLYDSVEVKKLNIYGHIETDGKHGALITEKFSLPPYAKLEADFYFLQGQLKGGNYTYSIEMQREIGDKLVLIENVTYPNIIKQENKISVVGKSSRGLVLGLMFVVFVIVMFGIVCCVLIKHKPGSLLA